MAALQTEFWPFSSYPMFNVRFDVPDETRFALIGIKEGTSLEIQDQRVLGPVRNGYLSRYCRAKIKKQEGACLSESLRYWAQRYKMFEEHLPRELRGFDQIKLIETISKVEWATETIQRGQP